MADTLLRKSRLAPPVPPPLSPEVYADAMLSVPASTSEQHMQTDEQIKHVGWHVIEATNQSKESRVGKLKGRVNSLFKNSKRTASRLLSIFDKFTPFQILGALLLTAALFVLITYQHLLWLLLSVAGISQFVMGILLKKKV